MPNVACLSDPMGDLRSGHLSLHRHAYANLSILKSGQYVEHSLYGKMRVSPGLAILNPSYHAHKNIIGTKGANIINVELPDGTYKGGLYELPVILCRKQNFYLVESVVEMMAEMKPVEIEGMPSWLSYSVEVLLAKRSTALAADSVGISREHFHRSFSEYFGMTPGMAIREQSLANALLMLSHGEALVDVAHSCGFADQSHMSRLIRSATGVSPNRFKRLQSKNITLVQE
jgi:AraC-like DNA-binding protein